jgi:hypothetical protein
MRASPGESRVKIQQLIQRRDKRARRELEPNLQGIISDRGREQLALLPALARSLPGVGDVRRLIEEAREAIG